MFLSLKSCGNSFPFAKPKQPLVLLQQRNISQVKELKIKNRVPVSKLVANPPRTFLDLHFDRKLPTDEILLDEKSTRVLNSIRKDLDRGLYKEMKEKEAVFRIRKPDEVVLYDPIPPQEKVDNNSFDAIWSRVEHREMYLYSGRPSMRHWRRMCQLAKSNEEWNKCKLFYMIIEKNDPNFREADQLAITTASINTGNFDYILSRVIEPAFRYKVYPSVLRIVLQEAVKQEKPRKIIDLIEQASRKTDIDAETATALLQVYGTHFNDNQKCTELCNYYTSKGINVDINDIINNNSNNNSNNDNNEQENENTTNN